MPSASQRFRARKQRELYAKQKKLREQQEETQAAQEAFQAFRKNPLAGSPLKNERESPLKKKSYSISNDKKRRASTGDRYRSISPTAKRSRNRSTSPTTKASRSSSQSEAAAAVPQDCSSSEEDDNDDDGYSLLDDFMKSTGCCPDEPVDSPKKPAPRKKTPPNCQEERIEDNRKVAASATLPTRKKSERVEDSLWTSEEEDDSEGEEQTTTSSRKSRTKTPKKHRRRSTKSTSPIADATWNMTMSLELDDDDSDNDDEDSDLNRLYPDILRPKFGPFDLEPLVLGTTDDGENHEVPASLARYLLPFQKAGIQFMYDCLVSNGTGSILGDDMGCGKTVQVIALLLALYHKTGTYRDLSNLQRRRKVLLRAKETFEQEERQALMRGEVLAPSSPLKLSSAAANQSSALQLSSWYPVLIVVPPTLVENWKREFQQFGICSVAVFAGPKTRAKAIADIHSGAAEIMLTSRSLLEKARSFEQMNGTTEGFRWKLVVLDEFHHFKNPKILASKNLRKLKDRHGCKVLGMTGTLIQNDLLELWNLVDLVETGLMKTSAEFKSLYADPIKHGRRKRASEAVLQLSEKSQAEIRKKMKPIFLERKKEDVLKDSLPKKKETILWCPLSDLQKQVYRNILTMPDLVLVKTANLPCDCGVNQDFSKRMSRMTSKAARIAFYRENRDEIVTRRQCHYAIPYVNPFEEGDDKAIDPRAVIWKTLKSHQHGDDDDDDDACEGCDFCPTCCGMPYLTKLYKLSNHLSLLQARKPDAMGMNKEADKKYKKELAFAEVALEPVRDQLPGGYVRNDGIMAPHFELSGKLKQLDKLLRVYSNANSRVLLFSQSVQSLDLIQNYVRAAGYKFLRMDGSTPSAERQGLADQFNKDHSNFLFLLSTRAMGTGLNLTSANKVIIFDVEWNPSNDNQAQDRAYRPGQKKDVEVTRLISEGSIDEMKYLRQLYKLQLKQEALEDHGDAGAIAPRIFSGVKGDTSRRGELFGYVNLFRLKDGKFLQDLWKKTEEKKKKCKSGLDLQDASMVDDHLGQMAEADETNSEDEEAAVAAIPPIPPPDDESDQSVASHGSDMAVDHRDLLRSDRGGVAIEEGEEGYDEEMGGETQGMEGAMNLPEPDLDHLDLLRSDRGGVAIEEGEEGYDEEMGGETQDLNELYEQGGMVFAENPQEPDYQEVIDLAGDTGTPTRNSERNLPHQDSDNFGGAANRRDMYNESEWRFTHEGARLARRAQSVARRNSAAESSTDQDNNSHKLEGKTICKSATVQTKKATTAAAGALQSATHQGNDQDDDISDACPAAVQTKKVSNDASETLESVHQGNDSDDDICDAYKKLATGPKAFTKLAGKTISKSATGKAKKSSIAAAKSSAASKISLPAYTLKKKKKKKW